MAFWTAESGDKALLAKIRELEARAGSSREQKAAWAERKTLKEKLLAIEEKDVRYILALNGLELRDGVGSYDLLGYSSEHRVTPDQLRRVLTAIVERVELDPSTRDFTICDRLPVPTLTGAEMASRGG